LTLKKYYGAVTVYCNQKAYDTCIKYIPYNEVIIKENSHSQVYWNLYKVDCISEMKESFIHVDSDVFLFKDSFRPYIDHLNMYDIIVQHAIPPQINFTKNFIELNRTELLNLKLINEHYDNRCFSCGVIGMNPNVVPQYIDDVKKLYSAIESNIFVGEFHWYKSMICEELAFYLTALRIGYRWFSVLPYEDIVNLGEKGAGAPNKYTHMWFDTKFVKRNIELIKNKIKMDFPGNHWNINKQTK